MALLCNPSEVSTCHGACKLNVGYEKRHAGAEFVEDPKRRLGTFTAEHLHLRFLEQKCQKFPLFRVVLDHQRDRPERLTHDASPSLARHKGKARDTWLFR